MDTKVYRINEKDIGIINEAADVIRSGGIVAFPTETVYGLGANALDAKACTKIYRAKKRPPDNPLIVHVADFDIERYVKNIPDKARLLMEAFWPGPITIIMKKSDIISDTVTAGLDSVGIRMPENKVARKLIEVAGVPIAAPSANLSGKPSPTTIEHCIDDLSGRVDMIIGGDQSQVGLESTVVDTDGDKITILRPGAITKEMLEEIVGEVEIDPAINGITDKSIKPRAPGMKYRHYAPKAPLTIVKGEVDRVVEYINNQIQGGEEKIGVMSTDETHDRYKGEHVISLGSRKKPGKIAANLFDSLREFDKIDIDQIYSEGFSEEGLGLAIMNRLKKAAGNKIIEV